MFSDAPFWARLLLVGLLALLIAGILSALEPYRRGAVIPGCHRCVCGYYGIGWTYVGWWETPNGGFHTANCPVCHSTRAVTLAQGPKGEGR